MPTFENDPILAQTVSTQPAIKAVSANHTPQAGPAVQGISDAVGVWGESNTWHGIAGLSKSTTGGFGVFGKNTAGGTGVVGESEGWMGVYGSSKSTSGGAGVLGEGNPGPGVVGKSTRGAGVYGETAGVDNGPAGVWGEHKGAGIGVKAVSKDGTALVASSAGHEAVHAETRSDGTAAIAAFNLNARGTGAALFAKKEGPVGHAGFFDGRVWITSDLGVGGDIQLANADCAESFDVVPFCDAEPGTVVRLGDTGAVLPSDEAYDHRVAGVVSGAGAYRPALLLDSRGGNDGRRPVALFGKVYCKVDADASPIAAGDLLTTSAKPGHAMKAVDREKAFGAVIGKALAPLDSGCGLLPILVALN
jgi:hypothetical protein